MIGNAGRYNVQGSIADRVKCGGEPRVLFLWSMGRCNCTQLVQYGLLSVANGGASLQLGKVAESRRGQVTWNS
jgi:hypothetical protein